MASPLSRHPEDIKAALRKQAGSIASFEREMGLGNRSVTDVLMGRPRPSTAKAIAAALGHSVEDLFPGVYSSAVADDSADSSIAHRKIGVAA